MAGLSGRGISKTSARLQKSDWNRQLCTIGGGAKRSSSVSAAFTNGILSTQESEKIFAYARPQVAEQGGHVIETYLERELRELLGYVKRAGDSEKA